jgi:hypothetical protein
LSASQSKALADKFTDVAMRGGDLNSFSSLIQEAITSVPKDKVEDAVAELIKIDYSSISSITSLGQAFNNLGDDLSDDFINQLTKASVAINDFTLEGVIEEFNKIASISKALRNNEKKLYDEEMKNALTTLAGYSEEDFVEVTDSNGEILGYSYVGNKRSSQIAMDY